MPNAIDYKKEYKDLYLPKAKPAIIDVPEMAFVAVEGKGNPNVEGGEYQQAVGILYAIQYTIKMSKMGNNKPDGYFDYVVPPLEGLWWFEGNAKTPPKDKSKFNWLSMIRLPEFVNKKIFEWACKEVTTKKKLDTSKAKFFKFKEGLCVQCMHIGSYDDEPRTLKLMDEFIKANGLTHDINDVRRHDARRHHEIYLSDPRKCDVSKIKTVLRVPVRS